MQIIGPTTDKIEASVIMIVDDETVDREAVVRVFKDTPDNFTMVEAEDCSQARRMMTDGRVDLALVDYQLPDGLGVDLLDGLAASGIPAIVVTGAGSESIAMRAIRQGVADYVIKDLSGNYLETLPVIVRNVLARFRAERDRERLLAELEAALEKVQTLRGLIPICANCKSIRDDKGYWEQLEVFISKHSLAEFSHGICPECMKGYLKELGEE